MILKDFMRAHDEDEEEGDELAEGMLIAGDNTWGSNTLTFFGKDSRSILISGEITQEVANCVCSQLLELTSEDEEAPIYVYINTDGGDVTSGLVIYDMMRIIPCPVMTIVLGACHSAGLFILQGGDRRGATPHASFFYHEPVSFYSVNTEHATVAHTDHYQKLRGNIDDILMKRSKITKTVWKNNFAGKTAFFFDAQQAKEYKMIDEIIDYAKPKPLKFKQEE
jgi:ATP-dependent Clp protease protease subunit